MAINDILSKPASVPVDPDMPSGTTELFEEYGSFMGSSALEVAKQHQLAGTMTPHDDYILRKADELDAKMVDHSARFEANRRARLEQEGADRVSSAGAFRRGGYAFPAELDIEGIRDPQLRANAARHALGEVYDENTEMGKAYLRENHPRHNDAVRYVANLTRLSMTK
jgi:hypothetical protein